MLSRSIIIIFLTLIAFFTLIYSLLPYSDPPSTVPYVDLTRYLGIWYEISAIPQHFSKGCTCNFANYTTNLDGTIKVENYCQKNDGQYENVLGRAWTVDDTHSKLKVQFFWPFRGDYWIVRLDADCNWVVVSGSDREYLWILARTRHLDQNLYDSLVESLKCDKFKVEDLVVTSKEC